MNQEWTKVSKEQLDSDQKEMNSRKGRNWIAIFVIVVFFFFLIFAISYHALRESKKYGPLIKVFTDKEIKNASSLDKATKDLEQYRVQGEKNSIDILSIAKKQEQINIATETDTKQIVSLTKDVEQLSVQAKNRDANITKIGKMNDSTLLMINDLKSRVEAQELSKAELKSLSRSIAQIIENQNQIFRELKLNKENIRILDQNIKKVNSKVKKP